MHALTAERQRQRCLTVWRYKRNSVCCWFSLSARAWREPQNIKAHLVPPISESAERKDKRERERESRFRPWTPRSPKLTPPLLSAQYRSRLLAYLTLLPPLDPGVQRLRVLNTCHQFPRVPQVRAPLSPHQLSPLPTFPLLVNHGLDDAPSSRSSGSGRGGSREGKAAGSFRWTI